MSALRLRPLLAVALLAALVACQDDAARLAEHMERAETYRESEEYAEAIIEYKNALQIDPNHAPAHWGLARSYLQTEKVRDGYWELRETVRLDPENLDARLQFATLSRLAGETDEALAQAEAILEQDPENVRAWLIKGQVHELRDEPEEALAALEKAVELSDEGGPLLVLANYHVRQGSPENAEPLLRKLTEVEPGFGAWAALARFLARDRDRDEEAEAAFRKALELAEDEEQRELGARLLASFYHSRDRAEQAESVLQQAIETDPGNLELIYLLARLYAAGGDQARADAMVEEATKASPDEVRPYLVLSSYRSRQGDLEGALEAAERALEVDPQHLSARLRKAELLLDIGHREDDPKRVAEGRAIVDAVLAKDDSSAEALFVKAKMDLAEGRADQAVEALRRAVDVRPEWAQAHFVLGSALFLAGERTEARAELTRALELDAALIDARRVLARVHAALGDHDLAVEEGRRVLREQPDDRATRILVAQSLVRQRDVEEAKVLLEEIPAAERDGEALFALGRIAMLEGRPEDARRHLIAAAEKQPGQPDILRSLLEVEGRLGDVDESLARIEKAVSEDPDDAELVRTQGLAYLMTGRATEGEEKLRKAIELEPNDLATYQILASFLSRAGRQEESLETYETALEQNPESASLHFVVGTLYEAQGDREKAKERYRESVRLNPDLGVAKNNLAYLLAEDGEDLDRALDLAQEAKAQLPDHPSAADTLGWVLHKKGVHSAAIGYLKEAEGGFRPEDPNLAIVRHHLAQAYEANQEPEKAREVLARAIADIEALRERLRERIADDAEAELPPEPAWMADIRSMHQRLSAGPAGETASQGG